mmetsp:Transcript_28911/g.97483  ORF Transcript_28911/g.97483 Transcript_28911/m.97483 type:complete len:217 (-) Transcript_28911:67-717(-)
MPGPARPQRRHERRSSDEVVDVQLHRRRAGVEAALGHGVEARFYLAVRQFLKPREAIRVPVASYGALPPRLQRQHDDDVVARQRPGSHDAVHERRGRVETGHLAVHQHCNRDLPRRRRGAARQRFSPRRPRVAVEVLARASVERRTENVTHSSRARNTWARALVGVARPREHPGVQARAPRAVAAASPCPSSRCARAGTRCAQRSGPCTRVRRAAI